MGLAIHTHINKFHQDFIWYTYIGLKFCFLLQEGKRFRGLCRERRAMRTHTLSTKHNIATTQCKWKKWRDEKMISKMKYTFFSCWNTNWIQHGIPIRESEKSNYRNDWRCVERMCIFNFSIFGEKKFICWRWCEQVAEWNVSKIVMAAIVTALT